MRRVTLWEIPGHLKCILWDKQAQRIISIAEDELRKRAEAPALG